jgi:hypothetical protein
MAKMVQIGDVDFELFRIIDKILYLTPESKRKKHEVISR